MRGRRPGLSGLALVGVLAFSPRASAHELRSNTARVSLRDGNLVIDAEIDVPAWIDRLGSGSESRASGVPLGLVDPAQLARRTAEARRQLLRELRVELDGERLEVRLREFPSDDAIVRAAVGTYVAQEVDHHGSGQRSRIVVEGVEPRPRSTSLSVTMPESLGDVLINVVEPQTQLAPAGSTRRFEVARAMPAERAVALPIGVPIAEAGSRTEARAETRSLLMMLGALVAGLLCGAVVGRRRGRES